MVRQDAQELLSSLTGIVSAHVAAGRDGAIREIHVLAAPDIHPKQVVRNIESALGAGLGLDIDRRIVSVAQMRADGLERAASGAPATPDPAPPRRRLEFVRYSATREAMRDCTCEVVLRHDDAELVGSASGPDTLEGRAGAAASAVFAALAELEADVGLDLEGAVIVDSHGQRYVLVTARGLEGREPVPLAGAARLTRSPEEAAILACLQATNRWNELEIPPGAS